MVKKLTAQQAFEAMVCFLEDYYHRTNSEGVGALLGSLYRIEEDEMLADPAIWDDWMMCVRSVLDQEVKKD